MMFVACGHAHSCLLHALSCCRRCALSLILDPPIHKPVIHATHTCMPHDNCKMDARLWAGCVREGRQALLEMLALLERRRRLCSPRDYAHPLLSNEPQALLSQMDARVCLPLLFWALLFWPLLCRCLSILASLILASFLWMRHNSSMAHGLPSLLARVGIPL